MSNKREHIPVHQRPEWSALKSQCNGLGDLHMRDLFADDPARFEKFSIAIPGALLDYSKHKITGAVMNDLIALARACDVEGARERMFNGEIINVSEKRAVLHTALRRPADEEVYVDGEDVVPFVHKTLFRMRDFSNDVRSGAWTGFTGKPIKTIINIGIGGSDLGPRMVCKALKSFEIRQSQACGQTIDIDVRFVSNIDGDAIHERLQSCDPEATLFIVASKSFMTQETMANAETAKAWLVDALPDEEAVKHHFVALSTNEEAVRQFGISPDNMFAFKDWVGGRYSVWSSIGLPICCAVGFDAYQDFLTGAHAMDHHFQSAPLDKNMPVIMALLGIWNRNFLNYPALAILPYSHDLRDFPVYMQQLDMESNGKGVDRYGRTLEVKSGPVVFGEAGTNAQHTFMQLLHQSAEIVPTDFIMAARPNHPYQDHHTQLLANALAQSQALMEGQDNKDAPHRHFPGNRPSSCLILDTLDAYHLGMLLALYEHKVFVQGVIWGINSFDQWGVELGKTHAGTLIERFENTQKTDTLDSSTAGLMAYLQEKFINS
ncbi:MAG: glucose-6-phosphate isomerase [Rhodospirillales bacterium]|nr:glucose-6-phosphate isomerase [Rhodospirillales bacterium]